MGGVSNSNVAIQEANFLLFSGTMSLENNGGFASVRSDWVLTDLSGTDGVLLRVLGDGKTYRLRIRTTETGRDISYNALFETKSESWILAYIPFVEMVPTYRGFVMDVEALDPASIGSFGFMISDEQPGEFELQVDWMRAISDDELRVLETELN
jgi:monofunctional biosynthetic peptidoglycan transglycosylase